MESTYDLKELEKKALLGSFLTEDEAGALQGHLSVSMMSKQSFDFGEIERKLNCGTLEADFLREQNKRFAKNGPKRQESKGFPYDTSPASIIPCGPLYEGKRGIERMLQKFRDKLAEVRERGVLP